MLPDVKINVPLQQYGLDDLHVAHSMMGWMEARGRGSHCQRYLQMLERLTPTGHLEGTRGLQSFVACLCKGNGELDITTYLSAKR